MISRLLTFCTLALILTSASVTHAQKLIVLDTLYEFPDTYTGNGQYGFISVRSTGTGSQRATLSIDDSNFVLPYGSSLTWSTSTGYAQIGFKPKTSGRHDCTLTISNDSSVKHVHLTGVGLYNHEVALEGSLEDTIALGMQRCSPFRFYAPLGDPATVVSIKALHVSGPAATFTFDSTMHAGTWVMWGDSITFNVCVEGKGQAGFSQSIVRIVYHDSLNKIDSVQTYVSCYFYSPEPTSCLAFSPLDSNGIIDLGSTPADTMYEAVALVTNPDTLAIQLDSVWLTGSDASRFTIANVPSSIAGSSTDTIHFTFKAPYPFDHTEYLAYLFTNGRMNGAPVHCEDTAVIVVHVQDSTQDTKIAPLPSGTSNVSLTGEIGRNSYRLIYHNAGANAVGISNVHFAETNSDGFVLLTHYGRSSKDSAKINDDYVVNLGLDASKSGLYHVVLAFNADGTEKSYNIAVAVGDLSVAAHATNPRIAIERTISGYQIHCEGVRSPHYEILDLFGRCVTKSDALSLTWTMSEVANGLYFVRVEGKDDVGKTVESTQKLSVIR